MPLYKRKSFQLVEKPKDLKPHEGVFQVRFTKEIFRQYSDYLSRINLYRQRVWTCKVTGKGNLTYEEALVSETNASKRLKQIPKEFIPPVLRHVQFSMLTLRDLVSAIAEKFEGRISEGSQLYGMKNSRPSPCKIIKILEDDNKAKFEVAWLDEDLKVFAKEIVDGDIFIAKLPCTREVLKSFIRESTYRNAPWVVHEKVARMHGISTSPPEELKGMISLRNGLVVCSKKRKKVEDQQHDKATIKSAAVLSGENTNGECKKLKKELKFPIEDLLVDLAEDDQNLRERPSPCMEFKVPMDCVGDLLMVWDFVTSFGRLLHLSPFSLEEFEGALCHKDSSNVVLIMECHSALLRLLMKEDGKFSLFIQNKKRKPKITLITWTEYLCDFMEMNAIFESASHTSTIKRGHYGLLDIHVKLEIFKELLAQVLETDLLREKLDENYDELQAFSATKRGEAIKEGRKRREEKEPKKDKSGKKNSTPTTEIVTNSSADTEEDNPVQENGIASKKLKNKTTTLTPKHSSSNRPNSKDEHAGGTVNKAQRTDDKVILDSTSDTSKRKIHKLMKADIRETIQKKSKEQIKEYLDREIEKRFIRHTSLGKDRDYNRYWFFRRDGRIFVENSDSTKWGFYKSKEELDAFMASLNVKGMRESALKKQLQKHYEKICSELQKRSKELALKIAMEEAVLRRSTRVRASPKDSPSLAFLKYENKWKED